MNDVPSRLFVVTVGTRDLPKLRQFYSGLGCQQAPGSDDDWAGFLLGGRGQRGAGGHRFAAATAAGATPIAEPITREWGGRSAYFADPEGNRWEIAYASSAKSDDRGALVSFG